MTEFISCPLGIVMGLCFGLVLFAIYWEHVW